MIFDKCLLLWFISLAHLILATNGLSTDENSARIILRSLNEKSAEWALKLVTAQWEFETNYTENAKKELFQLTSEAMKDAKIQSQKIMNYYPWKSFVNPDVQRQFRLFSEIGTFALSEEDYQEFQKIFSDLEVIEQNTTICDYYNKTKCDLHLNPDIREKLETSQNSEELSYLWSEWRKSTESKLTNLLEKFVKLSNKAASLNNFENYADYSLRNINAEDIKQEMKTFWEEVKPLYNQLHAYVRRKLRNIYGEKVVSQKGPIPAYLLGNIWSENWLGIAPKMVPFPQYNNFNFTLAMLSQNYTQEKMHRSAENYFASMNFSVPAGLWFNGSEKLSKDTCHPKIFNFYPNGVRIKTCEKISLKDFLEDIRLLTKAEYMLQYSGQPYVYQTPADPGLEKAVNDIMTMSVSTFDNLKKLGFFEGEITEEIQLNRLFKLALEKIIYVPFLLVQEFWRWDIFNGKTLKDSMTTVSELREQFQGISTFVNELAFDPSSTSSAFSKLSLTHYFLGSFLEFQLYESLCQMSKEPHQESDFNECNLYQNVEAGVALRNMMNLGSSKSFSETFSTILGVNKITSKSILKYFEPLMKWLTKENEKAGEFIGWVTNEVPAAKENAKTRRKRSLDDYQMEGNDDSDITPSGKPDRFQRFVYKRSDNNLAEIETNKRERKNSENVLSKETKSKNYLREEQKQRRQTEGVKRLLYSKNRRSLTKNNKNMEGNSKESDGEENESNNNLKFNKFTTRNANEQSDYEKLDHSYDEIKSYKRTLNKRDENLLSKRNDDSENNKGYENISNENNLSKTSGSENKSNQKRFAKKPRMQKRYDNEVQYHQLHRRKESYPNQKERPSRHAQWPINTDKDITRLFQSFNLPSESDDNEQIKELRKKLKGNQKENMILLVAVPKHLKEKFKSSKKHEAKASVGTLRMFKEVKIEETSAEETDGDSNSDLSNIASKESNYENMFDYNKMKSVEVRNDPGDEKANKLWSMKSFLTDNGKIIQPGPSLSKKESNTHLSSSLMAHSADEKSIGKKEAASPNNELSLTSGKNSDSEASENHLMQNTESKVRHLNIDIPSLQALLQKADMNAFGQRQLFRITPEVTDNKAKYDMNSLYRAKASTNKLSNSYSYKYMPIAESSQYKDKKEFREDLETGSKSPYIIILGQITPDMREKLMQEKELDIQDALRLPQFQGGLNADEKKMSDKRSRATEQIYIVPVNLKNTQHSLMKPNHYAEHEHEAGHDPNTERDQESEEEQLHLEDNSKLEDKSSFYKTGKESPSEFIISWNNEKNRKIVKRSKREHKKETGDDKLKVVRLAPLKESFLEGLLGNSLDHANLDDKNVKILIHDGLLNGNQDIPSELTTSQLSMGVPVGMASPAIDQSQTSSLHPSSSLSSLASSVLSALSPKGYSQAAKANSQHQEADLEEENLKESVTGQGLGKKKGAKLYSDDDTKKLIDVDPAAKGDDACCKKIILSPCPPKPCCPSCPYPSPMPCPCPCPCPCPYPSPMPCPCPLPCPCPSPGPCPCPSPCPCPDDCCKRVVDCPPLCCRPDCPDLCCKKPSECSLVNCQFKITKAKKPHERLTIMIYDRINPPAELPEPYDALAVISEILQRIQCCSCKPCCQLTEEDPDYPANDNSDQLKGNTNQVQDNKAKIQELSGEIPILGSESSEEDEIDDSPQIQISPNAADENKYQPKEKATPAIDQLTVFNKDKLKPVFIELRKIDDLIKKRSHKE